MNICEKAALASIKFEMTNTELKRRYLINNIEILWRLLQDIVVLMVQGILFML